MEAEEAIVRELVNRIVESARPLRIILFGSAARGEMGPDSDLDVLVVMPEGVHRRRTAQDLHQRMCGVGRPVEILVATPSDLTKHGHNRGLIYHQVLRDGRVIYAA